MDRTKRKYFTYGTTGLGKTHLALAVGYEAIIKGYRVKFITMNDLINELIIAESNNQINNFLKNVTKNDLLIIDEMGYLPFKKYTQIYFFNS